MAQPWRIQYEGAIYHIARRSRNKKEGRDTKEEGRVVKD